jgi:hypothetical protein
MDNGAVPALITTGTHDFEISYSGNANVIKAIIGSSMVGANGNRILLNGVVVPNIPQLVITVKVYGDRMILIDKHIFKFNVDWTPA